MRASTRHGKTGSWYLRGLWCSQRILRSCCRDKKTWWMMDDLFSFDGDVAVVTGGVGQLGQVYVGKLVERGAKVAIWDLDDDLSKLSAAIADKITKGDVTLYKVDITSRDSVEAANRSVTNSWGVPSILINNAALDSPPDAPREEVGRYETYPEESFAKVMNVNVNGTHICCQVVGGAMAEAGRGSIINISSIYGVLSPCQDIYEFRRKNGEEFFKPVAYSASKSAILNLTRYLATYWAKKGVRVNTVSPAGIFNDQPKEFLDSYCARVPIGRMADPAEIAGPVLFLASKASSYVTGANLIVDGGMSAW